MLERVTDNIWTTTRPQRFWGVETGTRMNVVRLPSGGLFVHCPVALDDATRKAVDALGEVCAIASSSLYHHLYAGQWKEAYPNALLSCCPGLEKKRADLPWEHVLGDEAHPLWKGELEQLYFSARFEKEVVFYDPREQTLITADAMLNLSTHPSRMTRAVAFLMANTKPGKGYLERIAVRDWKLGRKQVDRILEWKIDRILLAHGDNVDRDGNRVLRDAYTWL
jgi:hypothetical protein